MHTSQHFKLAYQFRRGPMEGHVTQYIANNVHKLHVFVRKKVRLYVDEFTRLCIKVVRDLLDPFWRGLQNTQNLRLIVLALSAIGRSEEKPGAVFIQWDENSIRRDCSPFS
jgi:hypothetical protein